ncbi:MAG TPA: hypothetical protein VG104_10235 [Candidatus Dormibacteraeota bacterium]|nr:hypothetical protein [Candidatus Dormibacteraeota bacterium]
MAVAVTCTPAGDGHRCQVEVSDARSTTRHLVRVSRRDLKEWGRGRSVEQLVRDSFDFLLQREPKESILREFDLSVIKRYFPEFAGD